MYAEFQFNLPSFGPAHAMILVLITYAQRPSVNAHANVYIRARDLNFRLSFHLQLYFMYAKCEGFGDSML